MLMQVLAEQPLVSTLLQAASAAKGIPRAVKSFEDVHLAENETPGLCQLQIKRFPECTLLQQLKAWV